MYLPIRIYVRSQKGRIQEAVRIEHKDTTIGQAIRAVIGEGRYKRVVFNGIPLDEAMPAVDFYLKHYSIDGFTYVTIILQ